MSLSISSKNKTLVVKFFHKDLSEETSLLCNLSEASSSVPLHVERGHVCEESLGSANVAGCLVSSDVLFSCLHRHSEGLVSIPVFGDSNDSARHLSLQLVTGSKKSRVRSSKSHWDTHSLS